MGWDAYAVRPEVDPRTSDDEFLTPALQEVFRRASQELASVVGRGSDNLGTGTLGGLSAGIFTRATGIPDYDESSEDGWLLWSPDTVRRAYQQVQWDFDWEDDEDSFLRTEARLFLKTCASHGLAIWFDW
jgi:hypothetical protein